MVGRAETVCDLGGFWHLQTARVSVAGSSAEPSSLEDSEGAMGGVARPSLFLAWGSWLVA